MRSSPSRASATPRCGSCGRPRTGSAPPRRSASSRWPATGLLEVSDPARAFLAEHAEPAPGQRRRARRWRAAARCSSRSRRWSRRPATGTPARKASGIDPNRLGLLVAVLGKRAGRRPRVARRLRQPRRRPVRRRSRAWTCRSPWPSPRPCAIDRSRPGPSSIGEVGLLGELRAVDRPGAAAARGRAPRVHGRDRAAAGARREPLDVPGLRIVEVATLRDAVEAALASGADRRGDALPAMLG